jgi:phage baseplate assembly protein W
MTSDPATAGVVVMPELVFSGMSRALHNQCAFYIKRMLLFEPRVMLASVPYRLD